MTPQDQSLQDDGTSLAERIEAYEQDRRGNSNLARAIREVHLSGATAIGDEYFPALVKDVARVLSADCVFIGRLMEDRPVVQSIATSAHGEIVENFHYELKGTPCEEVVGRGACVFPNQVAKLFPGDQMLVDMGVEGYVGVPLIGSGGVPIGIIAALYQRPVPEPEFASTLILVFAARTAAELDRLRQEAETRALEAQLLHAQKLESLGVLAGGLAHDFNNLLSSMLGSADLATARLPQGHASLQHLELIRDAATDAGELCRQLLAYAGKGRFEVVSADLSAVVRDQEKLLRSSIGRSASIRFELCKELPACRADVSQLRQILLNLVVNGSEALPEDGGVIRVATGFGTYESQQLASTNLPEACPAGDYVYLEVSDNGAGMSAEVRAKLFDPFFTTKLTGRGLGLAAILGIVKGHEGCIQVDSEPGQGSCFKIYLPASDEAAPLPEASSAEAAWSGTGLALLVDDDERVLRVCEQMIGLIGFEPLTASSGEQALEIFAQRSQEIAVVLLDLTMPGMSGEEVFRAMRRLDDHVPVVLTSGFNEQDTVQNFVGRGLAGFLQKPVRMDDMREKLRLAIEQAH